MADRLTDQIDPLKFATHFWPGLEFYPQQEEIMYSVWNNDETIVPAGHMLGKDFTAGFVCLLFFLAHHPCRVVTTSVDSTQLEGVLWGEIRRFIQTAQYPLEAERGGPLVVNHMHIRKKVGGKVDGLSYLIGRVAAKGEGMSGHHIASCGDGVPRTLFCGDEVSGVDQRSIEKASEWCNRMLLIGNPYECDNYFKWAVKGSPKTADRGGDVPSPTRPGCFRRKIIRIKAVDSPNVRLALMQQARGRAPTGQTVIPGVLSWEEYQKRRETWDPVKQCVGLDADFYEGAEVLLFPPLWLNRAEELAKRLEGKPRQAKAIGIDPAEGGDKTAMAAVDQWGLIELVSKQTPDTAVVTGEALAFMRKHNVPAEKVCIDRGGGGKEHADRLRSQGFNVQTVAFGESVSPMPRRGTTGFAERVDVREERTAYFNRRAEMYGELRELLDPAVGNGFAIPAEYTELRRQLAPIPLTYDDEGRLKLLPKNKRDSTSGAGAKSLTDLIGCSPDEADALVLAIHGMRQKARRPVAGGF
jgi:hypothetical protein